MSSTGSVGGVQETRAQAYARALEVWGQWLRQWRRTGTPRALHATLACKRGGDRVGAWRRSGQPGRGTSRRSGGVVPQP